MAARSPARSMAGPAVILSPAPISAAQDVREGGLAEAGRPVEQDVVQRLATRPGGLDQDAEVLAQPVLAEHLGQRARAQRGIYHDLFGPTLGRNRTFGHGILRMANQRINKSASQTNRQA